MGLQYFVGQWCELKWDFKYYTLIRKVHEFNAFLPIKKA
jgi:hypothetical protein